MIKLKSTAIVLLAAAALAGCGAAASPADSPETAQTATTAAKTAQTTAAAAETEAAGQGTAPAQQQLQTVTGELSKLPKDKANWKGLTGQEKLDDFDYLYKTLKENFPYLELIKRAKGVDMDQEYETYRAKVERTETDMQFFVLIQKFVSKGGGLGHLNLLIPGSYNWMVDAYRQTGGSPEEDLPRMRLLEEAYANQTSAAAYSAMADVFQETMDRVDAHNAALQETDGETSPAQEAPDSRLTEEGETDNLKYGILSAQKPKIAYIQIKSFDMSYYDEDKKL